MNTPSSKDETTGSRTRRGGLALVMVGALAVSVRGQVEAVEPLLGGMSVVLALTNDLAALLALNELMSTERRDVRRWAWAVLVLAGGTAAGLNTWHALEAGKLPPLWAVVVGIGPVMLAVVLSHLVALVLNDASREPTHAAASAPSASAAPAPERALAVETTPPTPMHPVESSQAAQAPTAALSGPGVHHGLTVVPAPRELPTRTSTSAQLVDQRADEDIDPRVAQLASQLRDGADLTGVSVAKQLGCSPRTGRRLLRQAEDHVASMPPDRERGTG